MNAFPILAWTLLLAAASVSAQEPVKVDFMETESHKIGPRSTIRSKTNVGRGQEGVDLEVITDQFGNVEEAQPIAGPPEFFDEAIQIELKRKFKPFEQNGVAVRAAFNDYVQILPPEQWLDKNVPFPEIKNWSTLKIRLERTPCLGGCPVYTVEIRGSGDVDFRGAYNVLMTGHHHGTISKQSLQNLVAAFRRANYLSLQDSYEATVSDVPTATSSIEFDGIQKSVVDTLGSEVGMPDAATKVEEAIDQFAGDEKWIKGNAQTGPSLLAEHWDFQSDSEENRELLANVTAFPDLVRLWTAKTPPPLGMTKKGTSPLIAAAAAGNFDLVKRLLTAQPDVESATMTCALGAAARSGNLPLAQYLISKGANPDGAFCLGRYSVLMNAALSGKPEMVEEILTYNPDVNAKDSQQGLTALTVALQRMPQGSNGQKIVQLLIRAGADVNIQDENQKDTPIFYACNSGNPEAVRLLIQAGADVNARNSGGQTVLMNCFASAAALKPLIEAGADLGLKDSEGKTAAESARAFGNIEKADLLDAAEKAQAKPHP